MFFFCGATTSCSFSESFKIIFFLIRISYSFKIDKYRVCAGDFGTKQFFVEINFAPKPIFPRLNFPGQTFYIINTALCDHLTTVTKMGISWINHYVASILQFKIYWAPRNFKIFKKFKNFKLWSDVHYLLIMIFKLSSVPCLRQDWSIVNEAAARVGFWTSVWNRNQWFLGSWFWII